VPVKNGPYEMVIAPNDYPGKKYRGRYVYEHQLVWWQTTGQLVPKGFLLHHTNEDKRDNKFSNLELLTRGEHTREHNEVQCVTVTCAWCRKDFDLKPGKVRSKQKQNSRIYCSRSCVGFAVGVGRPSNISPT
jgi:hypothetical protein